MDSTTPFAFEMDDLDAYQAADLRVKLDLVREARIIFGVPQAQWLWAELELPAMPPAPCRRVNKTGELDKVEALAKKIIRILRSAGGEMKKTDLLRRLDHIARWNEIDGAIRSLQEQIERVEVKPPRGPTAEKFVLRH